MFINNTFFWQQNLMPAWKEIKKQIIDNVKKEFYSQKNWNILKDFFSDEAIDEYIIIPLLTKLNIHLKKYMIIFIGIHILIISLIILNIFICLYKRK